MTRAFRRSAIGTLGRPDGTVSTRYLLAVVAGAALAGLSTQTVGLMYLGDLFMVVLAFRYIRDYYVDSRAGGRDAAICVILILCAGAYLALDLANNIDASDYMRGFARNALFATGIMAWLWVFRRVGLERALLVTAICSLAPAIWIMAGISSDASGRDTSMTNFFKYYGGLNLVLVVAYLLRNRLVLCICSVVAFAGVQAFVVDSRAGAGVLIMCAILAVGCAIWRKMPPYRLILIIGTIGVGILLLAPNVMLDPKYFEEQTIERREDSNRQRMDMVDFALQEIALRPLVGYGSWQSAARYVDIKYVNMNVAVHSMLLQYQYEYGVLGLIYPVAILLASLIALPAAVVFAQQSAFGAGFIMFSLISGQILNVALGGLSGYGRISISAVVALCLTMLPRSKSVCDPHGHRSVRRVP